MPLQHHRGSISRSSTTSIEQTEVRRSLLQRDDEPIGEFEVEEGRPLDCPCLPCCMPEAKAEAFGHHVSVFMVALIAFATFFCVTMILVLVFVLG